MTLTCTITSGGADAPAGPAAGTWSIVAVDVDSRQTGVALATCVPAEHSISGPKPEEAGSGSGVVSYSVVGRVSPTVSFELARLVPGAGTIVAQGRVDRGNADRLDRPSALLIAGVPAGTIVEAATSDDPEFEERQYGVASLATRAANFTGRATNGWAGGTSEQFVSVQGNLLVGPEVVDRAMAVFREVGSRPSASLGDALMAALEAGSAEGGDRRCPSDQSALSAFIAVAGPDDRGEEPYLWLAAPSQSIGGDNPVALLRRAYDARQPTATETAPDTDGGPGPVWWALVPLATLVLGSALWAVRRRRRDSVV